MLLIEALNIKKYYGDRLILDVENLKIYSEDRIGIVGVNGIGKTTLMNILCKKDKSYEWLVKIYGSYCLADQLDSEEYGTINQKMAKDFGVSATWNNNLSGGEKTRFKLAKCFEKENNIIFADEPTSNLDLDGIELLEKKFKEYKGALVIISHDRKFMDRICNKILELENGKIKIYNGNYSSFKLQKNSERERMLFEYEKYEKDKSRLEEAIKDTKQKVKTMRKAPARMGNSEARLHSKMGNQKAKANLDSSIRNMKARMDHLEVKEKPKKIQNIKLDALGNGELHSNIIISGKSINKSFENKIIFEDAEFHISNHSRTAFIGPNGSGKSTLIKMIMSENSSIKRAHSIKIGYFSQDMDILEDDASILDNVMKDSIYDETFARILLSRLLFKREEVYKRIKVLSGGERVKISFAKVFLSDINLLILDEPTNYLDINSLEIVEETLKDYKRTVLFVSHDRKFISAVANSILAIEKHKLITFSGNYEDYLKKRNNLTDTSKEELKKQILVLENRLSGIMGKLSMPRKNDVVEQLDKDYHQVLMQLQECKKKS
ncbi:MAG: ABC-F type ribosomal protection protein [Clostridiaceae bacterium]|nr:ABC-F type ribosomal protection protein [Clostridiaceae bacterium]